MIYGSACSGCGALDHALQRAGMECAWQIEIDPRRRSVLRRQFPGVLLMEDLRNVTDAPSVDLLAGATPCQDLSVAGSREGLAGERSSLFIDFIRLADRLAPAWILWENVPGVLSSHGGQDFALCLEGFTGARPDIPPGGWRSSGVAWGPLRWTAWRVLDAQHFGVPQRRRRVFVVAGTGVGPAPEVLLEPESLPGDPEAGRTAGAVASCLTSAGPRTGGYRLDDGQLGQLVTMVEPAGVRRLTPRECERLQGLPDDWTRWDDGGKRIADTPRYAMIGDAVAVPVVEWIGRRLLVAFGAAEHREDTATGGK